eukprot:scaffold132560_cov35-Tisochrysis_lutea.AAC.1
MGSLVLKAVPLRLLPAQAKKGVRVAHVDVSTSAELRRTLCGGGACPSLLVIKPGQPARPYTGRSSLAEVQNFVESIAAGSAAGGSYAASSVAGYGGSAGYAGAAGYAGSSGYTSSSAAAAAKSQGEPKEALQ